LLPRFVSGCLVAVILLCCPPLEARTPTEIASSAQILLQKEAYQHGLDVLEGGVREFPDSGVLWFWLGRVHVLRGNPERALTAFQKARALNPADKATNDELLRAHVAVGERRRQNVSASNTPFLEGLPEEDQRLFAIVIREKNAGNLESAFQKFMVCAAQNPIFLEGRDHGIISLALDFYRAREKNGDLQAPYFLAVFENFSGNAFAAEERLNLFLEQAPGSPVASEAQTLLDTIRYRLYTPANIGSASISVASMALDPAALAILETGTDEDKMLGFLRTGNPDTQKKALQWASKQKFPSAKTLRALGDILSGSAPEIILEALDVIGRTGSPSVLLLAELQDAARSDQTVVRLSALKNIGKLRLAPTEMVPFLIGMLEEPQVDVANGAVRALWHYGDEAIPALEDVRDRSSQTARERAEMALYMIRRGPPIPEKPAKKKPGTPLASDTENPDDSGDQASADTPATP
jgi:hypothetical protein